MRIGAVLTDLDGTLLEPDASVSREAVAALAALAAAAVPVCPVTSKTPTELGPIMTLLRLRTPAGFENGAGVLHADGRTELTPNAVPLADLVATFLALRRATGAPARSILDLADEELAELTGLTGPALAGARRRSATLPLVVPSSWDEELREALPKLPRMRLVRGNRFLHLQGDHAKDAAVPRLLELVEAGSGLVVACGDAPNDAEMLAGADIAVIIPGARGPNAELLRRIPDARVAPRPHGRGWAEIMTALLEAQAPSPSAGTPSTDRRPA